MSFLTPNFRWDRTGTDETQKWVLGKKSTPNYVVLGRVMMFEKRNDGRDDKKMLYECIRAIRMRKQEDKKMNGKEERVL